MVRNPLKVVMLPCYGSTNPYQSELANALRRLGVNVTLRNMNRLPILRAIVSSWKPDILHLHWTHGFIVAENWIRTAAKTVRFVVELLIVRAVGIQIVWTVHNLSDHNGIRPGYEISVTRRLLWLFDRLIVHCQVARDAVISTYGMLEPSLERLHVIPHGHYMDCYENRIGRKEARTLLSYEEDIFLFLFLGIIRPYKGILGLIDAFRSIDSPCARMLIAGRPMDRDLERTLLCHCEEDKRIHADLRFIPDSEIQVYMNAADVAVLPYERILTSGSAALAMSFGKAIVAPSKGCISETVGTQGGFLYDANDPNGLQSAMRSALKANLPPMGGHNRKRIKQFSWDFIARETLNVYLHIGALA